AEVGGNLDRERFAEEVLLPLQNREAVCYRRFDCQTQTLTAPVTLPHKKLTVVEGVYSTHPFFEKYYDLSVFLDVDPQLQRERIAKRNAPDIAQRYFEEWIPMEERYFSCMQVKSRCSLFMILAP
ncbi:MAG: uridine kinase, partial [Clostridia bacterium]|nr:uridine kinase [Clostridia bacterium]